MNSYFLDDTPVLEIIIRNPIMNKSFPSEGTVIAVLDTGFEGFLLIPETVFKGLSFDQFSTEQRQLVLANALSIQSVGTFGEVVIPSLKNQFSGFIETVKGVEEIVIGTELIKNLRIALDYCTRRMEVTSCK
ncbi:MAG: clan AA aspartic protease [Candidatus Brockarchaeota archaeon]|nr:clan AA aspartic protease [Candidatus Brockarchaeota archaeon]